ncbi:UNVERIFIED_CONTAM: hypothetical protein FKN15_039068 [Acipenser sinensis]
MENSEVNSVDLHGDEEIIEVIDLNETEPTPDDLAEDIEDVDFTEGDEGCETEDEGVEEMEEADKDDSDLTFSKHTGSVFCVNLDPSTNSLAVTGGEDDRSFVWRVSDGEVLFECTGSVFCVNLDPSTNSLAVTGGEDDRSFVWRVSDGEVLFECTGHKDSVTSASFSHDSALVATGDMSGLIKVWKVETKEEVWSFEVGDLEWMEWHPCAHVLLAGTADGNVRMWKIPSGECKTFQGPSCQATTGKILPDGPDGHQGPVTCVACSKDGGLILTGSVDCRAKLISTATGKVVGVFSTEGRKPKVLMEEESETNSIESVGFCNVLPLVAVAYLDGTLAIYDLSTQSLRHKCPHEAGIVHLQWEDSSPLLYTCSLDGAVRIWDARSGQMVTQYRGHTAEILNFTLNK